MRPLTLPKDLSVFFQSITASTTCCCLTKHEHAAPVDHGRVVVPRRRRRPRGESPAQVTTDTLRHPAPALAAQSTLSEKKQLLEVINLFLSVSLVLDH